VNRIYFIGIVICFLVLSGCSEEFLPDEEKISSKIPDDRLGIYLIKDLPENLMYKPIPVDSIRLFGERILQYEEIISYDTIYFSFEIQHFAVDRIAGINNKYGEWCLPFAVVCEGEVIFGAYLYHPLSMFFPYWFYSTALRQDQFVIYAPVWTENPLKMDPRKDPRIIKVLSEDGKIKSNQTE
jgi:hypothetical protein